MIYPYRVLGQWVVAAWLGLGGKASLEQRQLTEESCCALFADTGVVHNAGVTQHSTFSSAWLLCSGCLGSLSHHTHSVYAPNTTEREKQPQQNMNEEERACEHARWPESLNKSSHN